MRDRLIADGRFQFLSFQPLKFRYNNCKQKLS